jgi:hypothetical protein
MLEAVGDVSTRFPEEEKLARFGQNLHGATGTNVRVFVARPERTRILYSLFALAGSDM